MVLNAKKNQKKIYHMYFRNVSQNDDFRFNKIKLPNGFEQ